MMQPKRLKYRKPHRTKYDGKAKGNKYVAFGEYVGLLKYIGAAYILYLAINRILLKKRQNLRSVIVHFRVAHLYMHCHPTFSLDVFYRHRYCREYSTLYFSSSNIH